MKTLVAVLALALAAIAAPAHAQGEPTGIILDVSSAGTVPYMGSGSFDFTLDVGCAELAASGGADTIEVSVTDAQAWLNAGTDTVDIPVPPSGCVPGGRLALEGSLPFNVSAKAPAETAHTVNLKAVFGDTESPVDAATYTVAYKSNYTVTPAVKFPLTVMNKTTPFTVTGVQASNAPSMIMVDGFSACPGALVSGIGPLQYANKAGAPDTKTYTVTFTAPAADWETCALVLKVYSHFNFDGKAGDPTDQKTFTWEIANGGVPDEKKGGGKDSPAPVGALTALGLIGLAAVLRRRSD